MKEVSRNLFVGSNSECHLGSRSDWAVIHACKTCHRIGVGYTGNLSPTHSNYLIKEHENQLYLNLVDMDPTLMPKYTHPIMKAAMTFMANRIALTNVLVHCDQGLSRSPSIALLYLARKGEIPNTDFLTAKEGFLKVYPNYTPARGIASYLNLYWDELREIS